MNNAVLKRLPELVNELRNVECIYKSQSKYIGEAITYLIVLEDILKDYNGHCDFEEK